MVINLQEEAETRSFPQPEPPTCIICGLRGCINIGDLNRRGEIKEYCDLCLPPEKITKPVRMWICKNCGRLAMKIGKGI